MARELARNLQNQTGFRPPLRLENEEKTSSSFFASRRRLPPRGKVEKKTSRNSALIRLKAPFRT